MLKNCIVLIIKLVIAIVLFFILSTAMTYYQPAIGGSIAVGQLADTYSSNAGVKIWQNFKDYWLIIYTLLIIGMFARDIKKMFNKNY